MTVGEGLPLLELVAPPLDEDDEEDDEAAAPSLPASDVPASACWNVRSETQPRPKRTIAMESSIRRRIA